MIHTDFSKDGEKGGGGKNSYKYLQSIELFNYQHNLIALYVPVLEHAMGKLGEVFFLFCFVFAFMRSTETQKGYMQPHIIIMEFLITCITSFILVNLSHQKKRKQDIQTYYQASCTDTEQL